MAALPANADFNTGLSLYPFTLKPVEGRSSVKKGFDRASPRTAFKPEAKVLLMIESGGQVLIGSR
ncbi:MAG: hypothetical protein HC889_08585 [Synechococcaceae cyanobacterium SM1_2_3]|nr:hypothetical protein [Synechococcaceae cyanobacterium SM1_2_3]